MKKLLTSLTALFLTLSATPLSIFAAQESQPQEKLPLESVLSELPLEESIQSGSEGQAVPLPISQSEADQIFESAPISLEEPASDQSFVSSSESETEADSEKLTETGTESESNTETDTNKEEKPEEEIDTNPPVLQPDPAETILYGWNGETYISYLTGEPVKGFLNYNGEVYYFDENGMVVRNQTREINGKTYRFDETGKVYHGFLSNGDRNYYYSQFDGHQQSGRKSYDGQEYRLNLISGEQGMLVDNNGQINYVYPDGSLAANEMVTVNGENYYFDSQGNKVIGQVVDLPDGQSAFLNFKDGAQTDEKTFQVQSKAQEVVNLVGTSLYDLFIWSSGLTYNAGVSHYLDPIDYGLMAFENHSGNCYVYAAAFYYLADLLGYTIQYVRGQVLYNTGNVGDHAWTAIRDEDGKLYFYDPEGQYELGRSTSFWHIDPAVPPIRYLYDTSIL